VKKSPEAKESRPIHMPEIVLVAEGWLVLAKLTVLPKDVGYYCLGGNCGMGGLVDEGPSGCKKGMLTELIFASGIVAICIVIHITGTVILAEQLIDRREWMQRQTSLMRHTLLLIAVFAVIILLHLAETAIWAVFYQWQRLFPDYETSLYFSLGSYTTIGYGDVVLPQRWRLLGGIEGISGVLLCGLSTAFIFVIVNAVFQIRLQQQAKA
jgi:Ion channel